MLNATVSAFFGPANSASIPDLVPADRVNSANSLGQLSMQISVFLGQGLGGLLFRLLGAPVLFLVNAISFLYASASEVFVGYPRPYQRAKAVQKNSSARSGVTLLTDSLTSVRAPGCLSWC